VGDTVVSGFDFVGGGEIVGAGEIDGAFADGAFETEGASLGVVTRSPKSFVNKTILCKCAP